MGANPMVAKLEADAATRAAAEYEQRLADHNAYVDRQILAGAVEREPVLDADGVAWRVVSFPQ